ncbi:MAG: glycoside hydrolase family 5 protein [Isosphaerales bacterium]
MIMTRRDVLRLTLTTASIGVPASRPARADTPPRTLADATPKHLPRWRGFNLLNKFMAGNQKPFEERDFAHIAELGFDFVRLPMDYRCWTDREKPATLKESVLKEIDHAVELGRKHGVHVQINFHRAPGFTVAKPPEPRSLWTDPEILDVCARHWATFAARYQGIPNNLISFNLFNEPDDKVKAEEHRRVVERVAGAIRERDANRLIVCDGRAWGTVPPVELIGLNVAAALHDYNPMPVTHYKASWAHWDESWPEPIWPLRKNDGKYVTRSTIARELIKPWQEFEAKGVGVMVGEFGVHNQTPHRYVLSWMHDTLEEFKKAGWGWALWNFTGSFGVCDSGRYDIAYETWHGRKLDRGMLELLQAG